MATLTALQAASPLDASNNSYLTFTADTTETLTRALDNVDADFGTMDTLSWEVEYSLTGARDNDTYALAVRIVNGGTILAADDAGGTFTEVSASVTNTTDTTAGPTAFAYVNTGASKATWDGASVELRQTHTKNKGSDGVAIRVDFTEFTGTYTVASLDRTGTAAQTLSAVSQDASGTFAVDPSGASILYLTGDGTLGQNGDDLLHSLMVAQGHSVTVESDTDTRNAASDEAAYDAIWVSASVASGNVGTSLQGHALPIVNGEPALNDEFGWSAASNIYFGSDVIADFNGSALDSYLTDAGLVDTTQYSVYSARQTMGGFTASLTYGTVFFGAEAGDTAIIRGAIIESGEATSYGTAAGDRIYYAYSGDHTTTNTTVGEDILVALMDFTLRAVLSNDRTGTASQTLSAVSQSAAGTNTDPTFSGTASQTLSAVSQDAVGTSAPPTSTGTAAQTLQPVTQDAVGTHTAPAYSGTVSQALAAVSQDASGSVDNPGSSGPAAQTLQSVSQDASGTHTAPTYSGTAAQTLSAVSQDAAGSVDNPGNNGTVAQILSAVSQDASGTNVDPTYTGTASQSLLSVTQSASGTHAPPTSTGDAAQALQPVTQAASGTFTAAATRTSFPIPLYDPPSGWESYTAINWPADADAAGDVDLTPGNYVLRDQTFAVDSTADVRLRFTTSGVYNIVVWACTAQADTATYTSDPVALVFRDDTGNGATGTIHIEGFLGTGAGLREGFNFDCPNMDVTMVNNRINEVQLEDEAHIAVVHGDVIQPYGGAKTLKVDGLTGYTGYQGIFLKDDTGDGATPLETWLSRIDIYGRDAMAGTATSAPRRMLRLDDTVGDLYVDESTGREFITDSDSALSWADTFPEWLRIDDSGGLEQTLTTATDAKGDYATAPTRLRNHDDTAAGKVYGATGPFDGLGDYVPSALVGNGVYTDPRPDTFSGTASQTLGAVSQSADSTHTPPTFSGTAQSTVAAPTQDAAGTYDPGTFAGTAAQTLASASQDAAGSVNNPGNNGSAAQTLPTVSQSASGTNTDPTYTGTAAQSLSAVSQDAAGTFDVGTFTGTAAQTLPVFGQTATGSHTPPTYTGTGGQTFPTVTQAAAGSHSPPTFVATAANSLPTLFQTVAGTFVAPTFTVDQQLSAASPIDTLAADTRVTALSAADPGGGLSATTRESSLEASAP